MKALDWLERLLDPADAVLRVLRARRTLRALRRHTVALPDAARRMQALYARQKGGWLVEAVLGLLRRG